MQLFNKNYIGTVMILIIVRILKMWIVEFLLKSYKYIHTLSFLKHLFFSVGIPEAKKLAVSDDKGM